jgi:hypothetical protein
VALAHFKVQHNCNAFNAGKIRVVALLHLEDRYIRRVTQNKAEYGQRSSLAIRPQQSS